jgi:serine protease Do
MRRIFLSFIAASAAVALVVACTGQGRAGADTSGAEAAATAVLREAAAAAPMPAVEVPVGASLAPLIERLKGSVVNVSTTTLVKAPHRGRGPGGDPFQFFGLPPGGDGEGGGLRGQGLGSGFILSADGLILTNHHVVANATDIRVRLSDDTEYVAKVIGKDAATDVALIKLNSPPKGLVPVVLGDSDALRQGDFALALGSPFGLRETATLGIISAKHRGGVNSGNPFDDFLQTDAAINSGNSGGPLFNLRGEVVGINTAIVSPQIGSGIGFAVPINMAKALLPQLQAKGRVTRGYLGVSVTDLTPDLVRGFGLPAGVKGALVQQVVPKQPAAKAGLEAGDVVRAVNGKAVETSGALTRAVSLIPPGDKVTLVVLRRGAEKTFTFPVAQRPDELAEAEGGEGDEPGGEAGKAPKLGVRLQELTPQLAKQLGVEGEAGVLVADVTDGGPAAREGLARGDVIVEVGRRPVTKTADVSEALKSLKDGDLLLLRVRRGERSFFMTIPVGGRQ